MKSGCSLCAPEVCHCQSSDSRKNGSHPIPLSTDTKLSFGNRWQTPLKINIMIVRELDMKNEGPKVAKLVCLPFSGLSVDWVNSEVSPDPMWKLTDMPASWAAPHNRSQCRW